LAFALREIDAVVIHAQAFARVAVDRTARRSRARQQDDGECGHDDERRSRDPVGVKLQGLHATISSILRVQIFRYSQTNPSDRATVPGSLGKWREGANGLIGARFSPRE
jgi:hypothetical protein